MADRAGNKFRLRDQARKCMDEMLVLRSDRGKVKLMSHKKWRETKQQLI